jgi:membrane-anchored protein YejM (alkaline phosphatase superfamily)
MLKKTLDKLQKLEVIASVDEPTEWVSSLVMPEKKDGSLRLCLDPRDLNKAIMHEHYKMPTAEDVASQLHGKKLFHNSGRNKWILASETRQSILISVYV